LRLEGVQIEALDPTSSLIRVERQRASDPVQGALRASDRKSLSTGHLTRSMLELSAQLGYQEVGVEGVAERAGHSRAAFYARFAGKEECFLAALEGLGEGLLGVVAAALEEAERDELVGACLHSLVGFAIDDVAGARALFCESLGAGEPSRQWREDLYGQIAAQLDALGAMEGSGIGARALIGAAFRLLAMRLRQGASGVDEKLALEMGAWARSYESAAGPPRFAAPPMLGSAAETPTAEPVILPHGRHGLSDAEVARSQRERLGAATARLSFERGYASLSVTEITASARVSRNAFYAMHRDKQQVATEVNERFFGELMSSCAAAFFSAPSWPERVWEAARVFAEALIAEPERAYLAIVEPQAIGEAATQHAYGRLSAFTIFLEEGYRWRPQAEKLPRLASEAVAALIFEQIYRALHRQRSVAGLIGEPPLVYLCLAPFMGPEAAGRFVEGKMGVGPGGE
jgi:AcrR family transcriptional regulator